MIKILNSINLSNTLEVPEDNKLYIEGYCMHFDTINMNGEMVRHGAFDEFFNLLKEKDNMPFFNAFHKQDLLVGAWTSIKQDEKGLWVEGYLDLNVQYVRDNIAPLVRNGALSNLSTEGFVDFKDIENMGDYYIVNKMILTGISLVPIGADMETKIIVKNNLDNLERDIESEKENKELKNSNISVLFYI